MSTNAKTYYIADAVTGVLAYSLTENEDGRLDVGGKFRVGYYPSMESERRARWVNAGVAAFEEYMGLAINSNETWLFNGSYRKVAETSTSKCEDVYVVYESPVADFDGTQLEALESHPDTVKHGCIVFVNHTLEYGNAVIEFDDIVKVTDPTADGALKKLTAAAGELIGVALESDDVLTDIADVLSDCGLAFDGERVVIAENEEAA